MAALYFACVFNEAKNQLSMLGETYDIQPSPQKLSFLFTSTGTKGSIEKIVLFQPLENGHFNLAFGDIRGNDVDDAVVSDNQDFVKILSTVAKCAYEFLEKYPGAILEIKPVDSRRKMLYNGVFKRHQKFLEEKFNIFGLIEQAKEPYSPNKSFDEFELHHIF